MSATRMRDPLWRVWASRRGVTLMELLLASTIALFFAMAFMGVDFSRAYLNNQVRADSGFHTELAYAMNHMVRRLQLADLVVGEGGFPTDDIRFRVPRDGIVTEFVNDLDVAAMYDWFQYQYDGVSDVTFYSSIEDTCTSTEVVAREITALQFMVTSDNLDIALKTDDPVTDRMMDFDGGVTLRNGASAAGTLGLSPLAEPDPGAC